MAEPASSPRGDLRWRCVECLAEIPDSEVGTFGESLDEHEQWHIRPEHAPGCPGDGSPYCRSNCPVAWRCGPVVRVVEMTCSGCEALLEIPVTTTPMGSVLHVDTYPGGAREVCGRYEARA